MLTEFALYLPLTRLLFYCLNYLFCLRSAFLASFIFLCDRVHLRMLSIWMFIFDMCVLSSIRAIFLSTSLPTDKLFLNLIVFPSMNFVQRFTLFFLGTHLLLYKWFNLIQLAAILLSEISKHYKLKRIRKTCRFYFSSLKENDIINSLFKAC